MTAGHRRAAAEPEPATPAPSGLLAARLGLVTILAAVSAGAFAPVFGGLGPPGGTQAALVGFGGIAVPVAVVAALSIRRPVSGSVRLLASLGALAGYVALAVAPGRAVLNGPARLLTGALPADPTGPELAAVVTVAGLGALAAAELAVGHRRLLPVVPPLLGLVAALAIGASAGPPPGWVAPGFLAGAGLLLAIDRAAADQRTRPPAPDPAQPAGPRLAGAPAAATGGRAAVPRLAALVAVLAVVVLAAGALGPSAPGATARAQPFDARSLVDQPVQPRRPTNPLVQFPALAAGSRGHQLELTVRTADPHVRRLRMVTLTRFDGTYWTTAATYHRAGRRLPAGSGPPVPTQPTTLNVTVDSAGPLTWLPAAGRPVTVSTPGLGVDADTGDLVVPRDARVPHEYTVTGAEPIPEASRLLTDVPAPAPPADPGYRVPPPIQRAAEQAVARAGTPYQRVAALRDLFRRDNAYRYDEGKSPPSGHGLYQIGQLLRPPGGNAGPHRGTAEQYASAFAVLARTLGYQSRVVLGFLPGPYDLNLGGYRVTGRQVHAWAEVRFAASGWVSFDPSPRDRPIDAPPGQAPAPPPPDPGDAPADTPAQPRGAPVPPGTPPAPAARRHRHSVLPFVLAIAASGLGLLVLATAAVPAVKAVRRRRRRRAADPTLCVAGAWWDTVDRLVDTGVPAGPAHTTAEVTAAAQVRVAPAIAGGVATLAALHDTSVFAPSPVTSDTATTAWQTADQIRRALHRSLPPARRYRAAFALHRPAATPGPRPRRSS